MHDPESSHHELKGFEAQLAALTPRAQFDRDYLMFAAGRNAGTRRLRVANRLLVTSSVALAALLAGVMTLPFSSNEQHVRPEPPDATASSLAEAGTDDVLAGDVTRQPLALIDGPTNFRLRQRWELGLDERVAQPTKHVPGTDRDVELSPPSDARSLLKRYLNNSPDRL